jgi:putative CocE/NonD family hydrolase
VQRTSYREIKIGRQLLEPGKIYEVKLNNGLTSELFRAGHRIRVQISASFFPDFSRNLQTGELEANSAKMQKARVRIYHDREHASRVILPIVKH